MPPRSTKGASEPGHGFHLNATASSSATFVEVAGGAGPKGPGGNPLMRGKPPASNSSRHYAEANKTQSDLQNNGSAQGGSSDNRQGYIPEMHTNKPRSI